MADDSIPEEWRPVEGWPYEVSNRGRVRRLCDHGGFRLLSPQQHRNGHWHVGLYAKPRRAARHYVHRLVAMAFIGAPPSPDHNVAHWDGNPSNNSPGNLRWATQAENMADRERHGTVYRGDRHFKSKLTTDAVREIRRLWAGRECNQPEIARRYGVVPSTISRAIAARTWRA